LVRPETVQVLAPVVVQELPPGDANTVYPMMVNPPVAGADQVTTD
jgi:hypothetical protein